MRPHSQAALEGLATCAFHSNDYEAAARYCAEAGGVHAGSFRALVQPGRRRAEVRQRIAEAAKAYGEAVRIRPDAKQAHVNLGIVRQESGDLKRRPRILRAGSANRSRSGRRDLQPGQRARAAGREGRSRAALREAALARNPEWEDAWFRLGYLRLQRADHRGGGGSLPGLRPQADRRGPKRS